MVLNLCIQQQKKHLVEYWDTKTHKNDSASCSYQIHRSVQSGRGAWKKMTEMRSIVWMTIAFGCTFALPSSHQSEKFLDYRLTDLYSLNFVSSFLLLSGVAPLSQGLFLICPSHL